jgi:hypothetical protein
LYTAASRIDLEWNAPDYGSESQEGIGRVVFEGVDALSCVFFRPIVLKFKKSERLDEGKKW